MFENWVLLVFVVLGCMRVVIFLVFCCICGLKKVKRSVVRVRGGKMVVLFKRVIVCVVLRLWCDLCCMSFGLRCVMWL